MRETWARMNGWTSEQGPRTEEKKVQEKEDGSKVK